MKLSTICQWALVGIGNEIQALKFQEDNALYDNNHEKATAFHSMRIEAYVAQQNLVNILVKTEKGELYDEEY